MTHLAEELITQLGVFAYLIVLLGVGVESMGVPIPGETVLVVGAALAGSGRLSVIGVALAGLGGAVLGDNLGYAVFRRWGRGIVRVRGLRRLYHPDRLEAADRFFERRGWLAVFFGRFVALLRIFAGPLAGLHRMPWTHFFLANASGGVVWVAVIVTVGVLLGGNIDRAVSLVSRVGYGGLALAVVVLVGVGGWHLIRRRRRAAEASGSRRSRPARER